MVAHIAKISSWMLTLLCLPCVSMSCTRTDLVYLTRSERARDSLIVFLFLREELQTSVNKNTEQMRYLKLLNSKISLTWDGKQFVSFPCCCCSLILHLMQLYFLLGFSFSSVKEQTQKMLAEFFFKYTKS